ncbi:MAG: glycosyltransferase [Flavobacteriaceae bacterium]
MQDFGFSDDKLVLIYNSLFYDKQLKIRNKLTPSTLYKDHFGNELPVILYLGRIQKSKKVDQLVEAVKLLKNQNSPFNLVIVGKDVENNEIPKLANDYGLNDNIWFYGPCYDEEEIGPLIFNSAVCVSPGLIGLMAIHSLTYGTPVITCDAFSSHGPEFEAIDDGVTGSFFKEDDLDDLCEAITHWTTISKSKREKVRLNAYKVIDEKYNAHAQIQIIKTTLNLV